MAGKEWFRKEWFKRSCDFYQPLANRDDVDILSVSLLPHDAAHINAVGSTQMSHARILRCALRSDEPFGFGHLQVAEIKGHIVA